MAISERSRPYCPEGIGLFIFASTVVKFVADRLHNPCRACKPYWKTNHPSPYTDLDALFLDAMALFPDADAVRLIPGVVYRLSVPVSVPALHRLLDRQDVDTRIVIVIPALGSVLLSSENGEQPIQFTMPHSVISWCRPRGRGSISSVLRLTVDSSLSFVSRPWSSH
jgi:hypothetical protein